MRLSTYEIILPLVGTDEKPIEGYTLLTNGLYGAVDVVPKEDADKLQAGDFAGLPAALRERLMLRGHITRKDEAGELADLKLLSRIFKTIQGRSGVGLVIMPTYDCNFRCPYCFEQHRLKKGQDWLDNTMSDEMIETGERLLVLWRGTVPGKEPRRGKKDCRQMQGNGPVYGRHYQRVRSGNVSGLHRRIQAEKLTGDGGRHGGAE